MVNKIDPSPIPDGTNDSVNVDALMDMHASMNELHRHNQTLGDDIYNIRQCKQDSNPVEEMELLDL